MSTITLINNILNAKKDRNNKDIINYLRSLGKKMTNEYPLEFSIQNIIKRSIALLRNFDENVKLEKYESLNKLMKKENLDDKKTDYLNILMEVLNESEFKISDLTYNLTNFILDDEIILILGNRNLTLEVLIEAKLEKNFNVIIVDVLDNANDINFISQKFTENKINHEIITINSLY